MSMQNPPIKLRDYLICLKMLHFLPRWPFPPPFPAAVNAAPFIVYPRKGCDRKGIALKTGTAWHTAAGRAISSSSSSWKRKWKKLNSWESPHASFDLSYGKCLTESACLCSDSNRMRRECLTKPSAEQQWLHTVNGKELSPFNICQTGVRE